MLDTTFLEVSASKITSGLKKFILSIIWASIIGVMSLMPKSSLSTPKLINLKHADKVVHMAIYALLSILVLRALNMKHGKILQNPWPFIVIIGYGILLELLQKYTSVGRSFEFLDIIANISGVLLGIVLFKLFIKSR